MTKMSLCLNPIAMVAVVSSTSPSSSEAMLLLADDVGFDVAHH